MLGKKFWIVVIALAVIVLSGPIFFGEATGNLILNMFPESVKNVINFLILWVLSYLAAIILTKFFFGISNTLIDAFNWKQPSQKFYKKANKIALIGAGVVSLATTIYIFSTF